MRPAAGTDQLQRRAKRTAFAPHAGARAMPINAKGLSICADITRPAIANERPSVNRAGQVVLKLKTAFRDGTTHIAHVAAGIHATIAALVPRPRLHLIRFHGVLAPNAKLRAAIVPGAAQRETGREADHAPAHGAPARMSWARLLKRVSISILSTARSVAAA